MFQFDVMICNIPISIPYSFVISFTHEKMLLKYYAKEKVWQIHNKSTSPNYVRVQNYFSPHTY